MVFIVGLITGLILILIGNHLDKVERKNREKEWPWV